MVKSQSLHLLPRSGLLMRYLKTDRAHQALQRNLGELSPIQRRIVILCNGERREDEIRGLMGAELRDEFQELLQGGYLLATQPASAAGAATPSNALIGRLRGFFQQMRQSAAKSLEPTTTDTPSSEPASVDSTVSMQVSDAPDCMSAQADTER